MKKEKLHGETKVGSYEKQCLTNHQAIFRTYLLTKYPNDPGLLAQLTNLYNKRVDTKNILRVYPANINSFFRHLVLGTLEDLGKADKVR